MRKERGFTLIELLIVLAILAILIGIVAMSIGGLRQTAIKRGMQSEREVVETAINAWITLDDPDPTALADESLAPAPVTTADAWGGYLKKDSKYYYTWVGLGTADKQNVIVWDDDDAPTVCCTASACFDGDKVSVAEGVYSCNNVAVETLIPEE